MGVNRGDYTKCYNRAGYQGYIKSYTDHTLRAIQGYAKTHYTGLLSMAKLNGYRH